MANPNLVRWVHASVGKFLKDAANDNVIASLIEGIDERSTQFMEAKDRAEIRVNGPFTRQLSPRHHKVFVFVNVLVSSTIGGTIKNAYRLDDILGLFHEAMDGNIPIFKYGTDPVDEEELVGCLVPKADKNGSIKVHHFGQIAADVELKQGVVDAAYTLELYE